jgi:monoterpene epsilon-lactone hydrolase
MTNRDNVVAKVLAAYGRWTRDTTVEQMRRDWDGFFPPPRPETSIRADTIGNVPVTWIAAPGANPKRIFVYLHGGGFRIGSSRSHADLIARISSASGVTGLAIDYRMAPEHRFPSAIDDVVEVLTGLIDRNYHIDEISLAADSAGAALALSSVHTLRNRGATLPAALVLLSPWVDLQMWGESYETRAATDPIHRRKMLVNLALSYLGDADPSEPLASPIEADFTGFPPMLIHVGDGEVLLSDAETLADRARAAGVPVDLAVWPGMIHVFQQFPEELPEARAAINAIAAFICAPPIAQKGSV